ncbi:hypothetical protein KABACHOK_05870 [Brevundimonas phage vB_BpoS-Kabachok]|uniref:Uncharacterized protein n=1 Tax=Brevundimonas phage vB_BpoS-Kabachok TaxID=2948600 RepID=A0A9E7MPY6_9CAUD|nr:hypothetical protein KABACHOK_05870 [Brevundimonas phage vB_BpoS-Kabachok]
MGEVIPHRVWHHKPSGRTASIFGAVPWVSAAQESEWERVTVGWTVRHPDGTTGVGRFAFETKDEAQAWVDKNPNFPGMSQG